MNTVYAFPIFLKPGRHSYLVKYRMRQSKLLFEDMTFEDRYFVHKLIAPVRSEDIPAVARPSKFV